MVVVLKDAPGVDEADGGEEGKEGADAAQDCSGTAKSGQPGASNFDCMAFI